jgi:hypothetical protein
MIKITQSRSPNKKGRAEALPKTNFKGGGPYYYSNPQIIYWN